MRHHVYFSPGMFGFGRLGSYNYFGHVERELGARFAAAGEELIPHVIDELPTSSIRRRAARLAEIVSTTARDADAIHLLGHSTGGLDARLVASPDTRATLHDTSAWIARLRSVTTMNTPHYGTPLASFFTTAHGQRILAALSMLTVAGLTLGATPLRATSLVLGLLQRGDNSIPFKAFMLDRAIGSMVGLIDDASNPTVRTFLSAIEDDQGSMMQLSPESMDLVVASFSDCPDVHYQSTVSMAPTPGARPWADTLGHPLHALSLSLFFGLHHITTKTTDRYPCAAAVRRASPPLEQTLTETFGRAPSAGDNDGVVPLRSQLWGDIVWSGLGDHLDVLGHFHDVRRDVAPELRHCDWLRSGSEFTHVEFGALMDAIAGGMLEA